MDIFNSGRGLVAAIDSPGVPVNVFFDGWGGYGGTKSIVTSIKVTQQGGVQFLHTLRDFIYIYVYGERIGSMQIGGMSFAGACKGGSSCHGVEYVNAYYLTHRVSQQAAPVTIVIGCGTPFFGFLTGMNIDFTDTEHLISGWSLNFNVIPESSSLG